VRGLYAPWDYLKEWHRSTPARAGIIQLVQRPACTLKEHPRACGDYLTNLKNGLITGGAPPRVRGLCQHVHRAQPRQGSTPARAGIMEPTTKRLSSQEEHPRACGDY